MLVMEEIGEPSKGKVEQRALARVMATGGAEKVSGKPMRE